MKTTVVLQRCPTSPPEKLIHSRGVKYLPEDCPTLTPLVAKNTSCTPQQITSHKPSPPLSFYPIAPCLLLSSSNFLLADIKQMTTSQRPSASVLANTKRDRNTGFPAGRIISPLFLLTWLKVQGIQEEQRTGLLHSLSN